MIYLEIAVCLILILMCLLDDFFQEHLSYKASDRLTCLAGILTVIWFILIIHRWIFL